MYTGVIWPWQPQQISMLILAQKLVYLYQVNLKLFDFSYIFDSFFPIKLKLFWDENDVNAA